MDEWNCVFLPFILEKDRAEPANDFIHLVGGHAIVDRSILHIVYLFVILHTQGGSNCWVSIEIEKTAAAAASAATHTCEFSHREHSNLYTLLPDFIYLYSIANEVGADSWFERLPLSKKVVRCDESILLSLIHQCWCQRNWLYKWTLLHTSAFSITRDSEKINETKTIESSWELADKLARAQQ